MAESANNLPVPTMAASPQPAEQPFRFMDMARELRDLVYDELYQDTDVKLKADRRFAVTAVPRAALLRVSQQFSTEYADRIWKKSELVFSDDCQTRLTRSDVRNIMSSGFIQRIRSARFRLLAWCEGHGRKISEPDCYVAKSLRAYVHAGIREMPPSTSVTIDILIAAIPQSIQWPDTASHNILSAQQALEAMQQVRSISVFCTKQRAHHPFLTDQVLHAPSSRKYGKWTREAGWKAPESSAEMEAESGK